MPPSRKKAPARDERVAGPQSRFVVPYLREAIVHVEEIPLPRERADVAITETTKRVPLFGEEVDLVPRAVARTERETGRHLDRTAKIPMRPRSEEAELEEEESLR
jgi:hypothetical protein